MKVEIDAEDLFLLVALAEERHDIYDISRYECVIPSFIKALESLKSGGFGENEIRFGVTVAREAKELKEHWETK